MNINNIIHLGDKVDLADRNKLLRDLLSEHDCEITFTKKDGTERVMPCTLRPEALPKRLTESTKTHTNETISVWCLDQKSWRSFIVDNVKSLKLLS
jgi:hypothetical protein